MLNRRALLKLATVGAVLTGVGVPRAGAIELLGVASRTARNSFQYPQPEGGRVILDRALYPKAFRESPQLTELVRQKRLPPVAERIGADPLVIAPLQGIGRYGGTLRRGFIGPSDYDVITRFAGGPDGLLYWDYAWRTLVPNIASGFALGRDQRVLTLFLRRGMRWSDGAPFTADDILFWYTDMYRNPRVVGGRSASLMINGKDVTIEKVDTNTVQFIAPDPYPLLPELLAGWTDVGGPSVNGRLGMGGYAPKHYLSKFHPKYRPEAAITNEAREAGFANWSLYLKNRNDWTQNPELPVLAPWRVVSPMNTQELVLERNPYSIWVDTAGNQLPYIDRIRHVLCSSPEVLTFKALTGELDCQDRHLEPGKLPVLLSNRARSKYNVYLDPSSTTDVGMRVNLDYTQDPGIGDLLRHVEFRRALSLGIDRSAINETFMLGLGRPSAAVPAPECKYFPGVEWAQRWASFDLTTANRLLDELGLTRRDAEGFRVRLDRNERLRLVCQVFFGFIDYPGIAEMIKDQWRAIGVDLDVRVIDIHLYRQRIVTGELALSLMQTGADDPFVWPDLLFPFAPTGAGGMMGIEYARWFQSGGRLGKRPPPELRTMMQLWERGHAAAMEERLRIGKELIRMHVDQVLSIGLISAGLGFYGVRVVSNTLGNVPRRVLNSVVLRSPANSLPMTFFFRGDADGTAGLTAGAA